MANIDANRALSVLKDIVDTIKSVARWVIGFGLLISIAGMVLRFYGVTLPLIPTPDHMVLAATAVAYWAIGR